MVFICDTSRHLSLSPANNNIDDHHNKNNHNTVHIDNDNDNGGGAPQTVNAIEVSCSFRAWVSEEQLFIQSFLHLPSSAS